jgi:hypothetical protein
MKTTVLREKSRVLALLVERLELQREQARYRDTPIDIDGHSGLVSVEDLVVGLVEVIEAGAFVQEVALGERLWGAEVSARLRREKERAVRFPILLDSRDRREHPSAAKDVPWALLGPHEAQAEENHGQSLQRLATRGGLSPGEMVAVVEDRPWRAMRLGAALARLAELVAPWDGTPTEVGR